MCIRDRWYQRRVHGTDTDMGTIKSSLISIGNDLVDIVSKSREKIKEIAFEFIKSGTTILVHGYSRLVEYLLVSAAEKNIQFNLIVTETRPLCEGYNMCKLFTEKNVSTKLVIDAAAAYALEEVDLVLVGAEAVVENGGIINRIGTYTLALCAKMLKKPFYVVCESFKFARLYPLSQRDLPEEVISNKRFELHKDNGLAQEVQMMNPMCDYTPPELITLLFTDIGIFTPSAVSDELIKIFNLQQQTKSLLIRKITVATTLSFGVCNENREGSRIFFVACKLQL
eukprot:TRINITY_DN5759_c0_g1_i6.p1 TRINITY_DN5759_c0_g1~~TRINITY_DN5759_c0_g1_i6.p1  ORF type:complete len:283 (-),score=53.76 TRINITY_DN5759_c0_g1_i6:104-952(-)